MSVKIGELAEMTGCRVVTVRYYEKAGLMSQPARTEKGYRLYKTEDIERLKFIRHCRAHGMSLDEIKTLLLLRDSPERDCSAVGAIVDRHITDLDEQIKSLKRLKAQLLHLRRQCSSQGAVSSCGIMKGLNDLEVCGCLTEEETDRECLN
jgi:Cd(II)/Pb(II)-responsive transcriptional regulator